MVVLQILIGALRLDGLKHALEFTYEEHVLVQADEGFRPVRLQFLLDGSGVLVERYVRTGQGTCAAFLGRFDDL